jgi:sugar phosphate isomerase/epimerase
MAEVQIGINLEFDRHADRGFEQAMADARDLGFEYVEPMVHWGRELLSEAGYFHSVSMLDDPLRVRRAAERNDLKLVALSAHSPLCRPDISVDYLKQAVRFAAECGAPVICTDDGPSRPAWASADEHHVLMRYVLEEVLPLAAARGVTVALETHAEYTAFPAALDRVLGLVDSPALAVNFDTGNAYLSGNDPAIWLAAIINRVSHLHAKDISQADSDAYRGKVWGMLGCACGEGMVDWERIVSICRRAPRDIVLSIECSTPEEATKSREYLEPIVRAANARGRQ